MLSKPNRDKYWTNFLPDVLVIACCMMSMGFSIIESRLNIDAYHWGLMYANAADLNKGLIPYKEIFIQYGFLTTLIQSLSLKILGNTVVSVGIITGVFYAASIYLSYCLWQKILDRWLAGLSAALMFLIHPYIIYPWANYFSYTFLLVSLLILTKSPERGSGYFLAGVFLAFSFLARQTVIVSTLIPIYLYFIIRRFASDKVFQDSQRRHIVMFHLGMLSVAAVFVLFLFRDSAVRDWTIQSFKIGGYYVSSFRVSLKIILKFAYGLISATAAVGGQDVRAWLYTFAFFNNLVIGRRIFLKFLRNKASEKELSFFLFGSVALFGYLQSFHIYEVFRLQNASSLGIGLLVFSLYNDSRLFKKLRSPTKLANSGLFLAKFQWLGKFYTFLHHKKWKRLTFDIPIICLVVYLTITLLFTKTSSAYNPWNKNLLFSNQLGAPKDIDMLKGKLYDSNMRMYYQNLSQVLGNYRGQLKYLVNLTHNSYIPLLSVHYKRVQRAPYYIWKLSQMIFQDEQEEIVRLLAEEQAILVAENPDQIPKNYRVVLALKTPKIPYVAEMTYVAVPRDLSRDFVLINQNSELGDASKGDFPAKLFDIKGDGWKRSVE